MDKQELIDKINNEIYECEQLLSDSSYSSIIEIRAVIATNYATLATLVNNNSSYLSEDDQYRKSYLLLRDKYHEYVERMKQLNAASINSQSAIPTFDYWLKHLTKL